jgi:large repetitive protein
MPPLRSRIVVPKGLRGSVRIVLLAAVVLAVTVCDAAAYGIFDDPVTGGAVGSPYAFALQVRGGSPPHSFRVSSGVLPPGIVLARDGTLAGVPKAAGTFEFYVEAKDAWNPPMLTQRLVTISFVPKLPLAEVGRLFRATLQTPGTTEPLRWEPLRGPLPPGLALQSGSLVGTPTLAGTFPLKLAATDGKGHTATLEFTLTIVPKLAVATVRLPATKLGRPYESTFVARGGFAPLNWKIVQGRLPIGLRLNTATGALRGKPRTPGLFSITLKVTESLGTSSTRTYVLAVRR